MAEEEKASGINPPESIDTEIVVQEVIEQTAAAIHEYSDSSTLMLKRKRQTRCDKVWKHLVKAKIRLNESPKTRKSGSETLAFLAKKEENDAKFCKEELRLKSEE